MTAQAESTETKAAPKRRDICPAENPFLGVKKDAGDTLAEARIPLAAVIFDLGELRHAPA